MSAIETMFFKRTTSGGERKQSSSSTTAGSPPKIRRLRNVDHDLTVVVGKETFHHYSVGLRLASEYFDTMLSTPMSESETKVVKFPTKDPDEWKVVSKFMDPSTARSVEITSKNVRMLIPWFHELQMSSHLAECDQVLAKIIMKQTGNRIFSDMQICIKYDLKESLDKGIALVKKTFKSAYYGFNHGNYLTLFSVMECSPRVQNELWPLIRCRLNTDNLRNAAPEEVLGNPLSKDLLASLLLYKARFN